MSTYEQPLVSIVTPTYNMGAYLAECIESVLMQDYKNFEYIVINNCSTDDSRETALGYAQKDSRMRVHNNDKFVGVIENHNIAFSLISPTAKYVKVVSADDFIFPDCVRRMVEVAEANPSAGMVGSYQLSGSQIKWQGFRYPKAVFSGREICRQVFLGGQPSFGFGTPTSLLYRADLVRETDSFYPNSTAEADTSACFKYLQKTDFGFVYQVLSYERTHGNTQSAKSAGMNRYAPSYLGDVVQYGPFYLSGEEFERKLKEILDDYYRFLAVSIIRFKDKEFWDYHKRRLGELGYPLRLSALAKAGTVKVLKEIVNPEQATRKFWKRVKTP
jgi:glycosyltransferase involved in cell wall biosynthesis